jgi:ubiquinone/menaquinone biosynthesis C-methylase UbiE
MADDRNRTRDEWSAVASGWRRWEPLFQSFAWPVALRMASVSGLGDGQRVLDVGCGIGDPTLQVAVLIGPHGHVLGVDLVDDMIATARERAAALGLAHAEFRAADVRTMPLEPATYDVVLARWSVIYVDDVVGVFRRLRDALKPGGRIAVTAWAPPDANPWIALPMAELGKVLPMPPVDTAVPGLFHLSANGALAAALHAAGFERVAQERVRLSQFARNANEYWAMLTDMAGPLAPLLAGLGEPERAKLLRGVTEQLARFRQGDVYRIPAEAQLAWGER